MNNNGSGVAARLLGRALLLTAAASVSACGSGGGGGTTSGGGGGTIHVLVIDETPLPTAQIGFGYAHTLTASGGTPPYAWSLAPGSVPLPLGLSLDGSGRLSGTPTVRGDTIPDLLVRDAGSMSAHAPLVVRVGAFDVTVEGLEDREAWTGEPYQLNVSPFDAIASVVVLAGSSGSTATLDDPYPGMATVHAGARAGSDTLRVTNATGVVTEFVVPIAQHPAPQMVARFGTTDVWSVGFDAKEDASHPYASDFDASLVALGLRAATSTDAYGTKADRLARLLVRKRTLRYLGVYYGCAADGTPASGGPAISFPLRAPYGPVHKTPAAGATIAGAKDSYNRIDLNTGPITASFGYSIQDDALNSWIENVATAGGTRRGVFLEAFTGRFNAQYANTVLPAAPVSVSDVSGLSALLYDAGPTDARSTEIERIADGAGRILGAFLAHEIGHALGLQHPSGSNGYLMDPLSGLYFTPGTVFTFSPSDFAALKATLPGPGR